VEDSEAFRRATDIGVEIVEGLTVFDMLTTLVRRKNLFGRFYLLAVGPFHRRIVPATMRPFCTDVRPVSTQTAWFSRPA